MAASRKLYTAVAETLGREMFFADNTDERALIFALAEKLADDFKQENMSFDRAKFLGHVNKFHAALITNHTNN